MDATQAAVIRLYNEGEGLKIIAARLNISQQKARKILVTAGLYDSDHAREIAALSKQGLTVAEIAERLKTSVKVINSYIPYKKGMYNAEYQTINALRIKKCRNAKKEEETD